ncbi:MAG: hypothetical protein JOY68_09380 [Candidatus Dormibacteraeota bacterium]|nr:hypothetical protein [Candidatus Dormibacteraeota bacterium]
MLSTALRLGLVVLLPAAAALGAWFLPPRFSAVARIGGLAALAVTLGFLAGSAQIVASGARLAATFGAPVGGVRVLLRADPQGVIVAVAACGAGLLCLARRGFSTTQTAGLLLCVTGALTASLGGNAVMLFAGFELANAGTAAMLTAGGERSGRAVWLATAVQHAAGLALLTAAVELQTSTGTSDFSVLPADAVGPGIALLWLGAAGVRLVAPGLYPGRRGVAYPAWAVAGAIPVAAIALLRFREAVSDHVPAAAGTTVAVLACVVAVVAAGAALRRGSAAAPAGRALAVLAAAPAVAVAGVSGAPALTGLAAGLVAVEVAVALGAMWEPHPTGGRLVGALAALSAGGLPVGAGAVALLLELSALATAGRPVSLLLVPLGLAALAGAAAAARLAAGFAGNQGAAGHGLVQPVAAIALAAGGAAAVVPGLAVQTVVGPLATGNVARLAGAATVLSPGGGWAGGYIAVAGVVLVVMLLAAGWLAEVTVRPAAAMSPHPVAGPLLPLHVFRRWHRALARSGPALDAIDRWLLLQPQLPMVVAVAVGALLVVH